MFNIPWVVHTGKFGTRGRTLTLVNHLFCTTNLLLIGSRYLTLLLCFPSLTVQFIFKSAHALLTVFIVFHHLKYSLYFYGACCNVFICTIYCCLQFYFCSMIFSPYTHVFQEYIRKYYWMLNISFCIIFHERLFLNSF